MTHSECKHTAEEIEEFKRRVEGAASKWIDEARAKGNEPSNASAESVKTEMVSAINLEISLLHMKWATHVMVRSGSSPAELPTILGIVAAEIQHATAASLLTALKTFLDVTGKKETNS